MQDESAARRQQERALLTGTAEECTSAERSDADVHGSAGVVPSNTTPANCKVLRSGIDSLYLSFQGELSETWAGILDSKKKQAQGDNDSEKARAWVSVVDHQLAVGPFGRNVFRYVLQDNAYRIELAGLNAKRVPLAHCKISSEWLTYLGVEQAVSQLRLIVSAFGTIVGDPTVSRIDLCADFTTDCPLEDVEQKAWVTRAREFDRHSVGGVYSGISVGRSSPIKARLYVKTLEIELNGKQYMKALWHQAGWEPGERVFRLEFQYRRDVLRELGMRTFAEVQAKCGILWAYASQDWLRLSVPSPSDGTKSRWPTHPLWQVLQGVSWGDVGKAERNPASKDRAPADQQLVRMYVAVLTSYMAAKGLHDPLEAAESLDALSRTTLDSFSLMSGVRFEEVVRGKALRKAVQFNTPMPGQEDGVKDAHARAYRKATGRG